MDELLAAAAEALNAPEEMVERSAQARAKADGTTVEAVLALWSGGEAPAAAAAASPAAASEPAPAVAAPASPAPSGPIVPDPNDRDSLIAAAAARKNLPVSMVERSAEARAKAAGTDVQDVLLEWAGDEPVTPPAPPAVAASAAPAPTAEPAPAADPAPAAPAAAAAPAGDPAAVLAAAAEKMGMSESMVQRSAGARAKAQGVDVDTVLAEWAGLEAGAAPAPTAPAAEPAAADAPAAEAAPAPAAAEPAADAEPEAEPEPEPETEPDIYESEMEAVAAGALPRWLAALFVVIPAFAIGYALFLPNGPNCGDAGSLAVDPVTGLAVNCDGSDYGSAEVDLFSLGESVYNGIGCAACHGGNGAGVASFPGFTGGALLATFPEGTCSAQIEWIALGTTGWPEATYGENATPVGGSGAVMPGFEASLTPDELVAVSLYERVAFGGQDLEAAIEDCSSSAEGETASAVGP